MLKEPMSRSDLVSINRFVEVLEDGPEATVVRFPGRQGGVYVARCTCGYLTPRRMDPSVVARMARRHFASRHIKKDPPLRAEQ